MSPRANTISTNPQHTWLARTAAALVAASAFALVPHAQAATFISVGIAPPPLPVYEQPIIPGPGYMWTPGFWSYDNEINDYFWVPGTWVMAPRVGYLWTPGYWGYGNNVYLFHPGYWGPHIGYYGGINYGYGYLGLGYVGGYWRGGGFYYNTAYNHWNGGGGINIHIYNQRASGNFPANRFSFNGPGGADRQPNHDELAAEHEHHVAMPAEQVRHLEAARHDPTLRASVNHGSPALAATTHAGAFDHGHEVESHTDAHGHEAANHSDAHGHDGGPGEPMNHEQHQHGAGPENPMQMKGPPHEAPAQHAPREQNKEKEKHDDKH